MTQKKNIWVEGIEQEIAKAPFKKLLWGFVAFVFGIGFYFLVKYDAFVVSRDFSFWVIILGFFIAIAKIIESPKSPDYLAYYLYKIGDEFIDFEVEPNYLKRNQNYVKNCNKQITNLNEVLSGYFVVNIVDFLDNLEDINLRLNHIYSKENIDDALMSKLNEIRVLVSVNEMPMTKRDVISSKIIELANLIHKNNSSLTQQHVDIANEILNELKDIPEKRFEKPISEYPKEIWGRLPYKLKYLIFGISVFVIIFLVLSQILMHLTQGEPYSTAMLASAPLTAVVLTQIDRFITREKVK